MITQANTEIDRLTFMGDFRASTLASRLRSVRFICKGQRKAHSLIMLKSQGSGNRQMGRTMEEVDTAEAYLDGGVALRNSEHSSAFQ